MTRQDAVAKLVRLYMAQQSLDEQFKEVKEEIKESGMNPSILSSVARSISNGKANDLREKSEEIIEIIEEVL